MKLKIVHQNQESRGASAAEEQVAKNEAAEVEQAQEEPQIHASTEDESTKEDSPAPEAPPVSASHPMLVSLEELCGKRIKGEKGETLKQLWEALNLLVVNWIKRVVDRENKEVNNYVNGQKKGGTYDEEGKEE